MLQRLKSKMSQNVASVLSSASNSAPASPFGSVSQLSLVASASDAASVSAPIGDTSDHTIDLNSVNQASDNKKLNITENDVLTLPSSHEDISLVLNLEKKKNIPVQLRREKFKVVPILNRSKKVFSSTNKPTIRSQLQTVPGSQDIGIPIVPVNVDISNIIVGINDAEVVEGISGIQKCTIQPHAPTESRSTSKMGSLESNSECIIPYEPQTTDSLTDKSIPTLDRPLPFSVSAVADENGEEAEVTIDIQFESKIVLNPISEMTVVGHLSTDLNRGDEIHVKETEVTCGQVRSHDMTLIRRQLEDGQTTEKCIASKFVTLKRHETGTEMSQSKEMYVLKSAQTESTDKILFSKPIGTIQELVYCPLRKRNRELPEQEGHEKAFFERKLAHRRKISNVGGIDAKSMTMFDLIFYNPAANPMPGRDNKGRIHQTSDAASVASELQEEETEMLRIEADVQSEASGSAASISKTNLDINPEASQDTCDSDAFAPRIKIGPDGQIVIDERSLVIQTTAARNRDEVLGKSQAIDEGGYLTRDESNTYNRWSKKRQRSKEWTIKETAMFYKALSTVGTDFSLMAQFLKWRTRTELKTKFKKEERLNHVLIDKALNDDTQFDVSFLKEEADYDPAADRSEQKRLLRIQRQEVKKQMLEETQQKKKEQLGLATCKKRLRKTYQIAKKKRPVRISSGSESGGNDSDNQSQCFNIVVDYKPDEEPQATRRSTRKRKRITYSSESESESWETNVCVEVRQEVRKQRDKERVIDHSLEQQGHDVAIENKMNISVDDKGTRNSNRNARHEIVDEDMDGKLDKENRKDLKVTNLSADVNTHMLVNEEIGIQQSITSTVVEETAPDMLEEMHDMGLMDIVMDPSVMYEADCVDLEEDLHVLESDNVKRHTMLSRKGKVGDSMGMNEEEEFVEKLETGNQLLNVAQMIDEADADVHASDTNEVLLHVNLESTDLQKSVTSGICHYTEKIHLNDCIKIQRFLEQPEFLEPQDVPESVKSPEEPYLPDSSQKPQEAKSFVKRRKSSELEKLPEQSSRVTRLRAKNVQKFEFSSLSKQITTQRKPDALKNSLVSELFSETEVISEAEEALEHITKNKKSRRSRTSVKSLIGQKQPENDDESVKERSNPQKSGTSTRTTLSTVEKTTDNSEVHINAEISSTCDSVDTTSSQLRSNIHANTGTELSTNSQPSASNSGQLSSNTTMTWRFPASSVTRRDDGQLIVCVPTTKGTHCVPVPPMLPGTSEVIVMGVAGPDGEMLYHVFMVTCK